MSRRLWMLAGGAGIALLAAVFFMVWQTRPGRVPPVPSFNTELAPAGLPRPESLGAVLPPEPEPPAETVRPPTRPAAESNPASPETDPVRRLEQKGILAY